MRGTKKYNTHLWKYGWLSWSKAALFVGGVGGLDLLMPTMVVIIEMAAGMNQTQFMVGTSAALFTNVVVTP